MRILICLMLFVCFSCKKESSQPNHGSVKSPDSVSTNKTLELTKKDSLKILNEEMIGLFESKQYLKISDYLHPEKGVRFSMYAYINPEKDKVFSKTDYEKYIGSNVKFTFGERDGSGEPLVLSLKDYFDKWVFKRDFSQSKFTLNEFQGHGNSLNNLKKIYPNSDFTENFIAGSEKYSGMDWNSLRFVFEKLDGKYYLVAIINDEWTI